MQHAPSVLIPSSSNPFILQPPLDAYTTIMPDRAPSPNNRRQRISMACQYCRHRKIRCCGGAPCRNCLRSQRECEYAPVPEEVNKATREKKAIAKAAKSATFASPISPYSPYFVDTPVYNVPSYPVVPGVGLAAAHQRPVQLGHRRSVSVPSLDASPWIVPQGQLAHTPAAYEQWQHNDWCSGPPVPSNYPSVFEPPKPTYIAPPQQHPPTPPDSRSTSSSEASIPTSWSTPNLHLRVPALTPGSSRTPHSPISPMYYSPHPTPPLNGHAMYQSPYPSPMLHQQPPMASPTLAPEMSLPSKDLVGLGIGMQEHHIQYIPEDYYGQRY